MPWTITLHEAAKQELDDQPADIRAKLAYIVKLIETFGLSRVPVQYAKHLQGALWEFRLKGKDVIARALYVTALDQRIVIVRVFVKKTQKTPRREIKIALARAKDVQ
jgi:phage-related protein